MRISRILATFFLVLAVRYSAAIRPRIRIQHFDDYLEEVGRAMQSENSDPRVIAVTVAGPADEDDHDDSDRETQNGTEVVHYSGSLEVLAYFRDVPRDHWSCCMLGKLAGDKGFHCEAQFYEARIRGRNFNRAHNRRLPLYGQDRIPGYGKHLMTTLQNCVKDHRHASEFHKCCFAATAERLERRIWQNYRELRHRK